MCAHILPMLLFYVLGCVFSKINALNAHIALLIAKFGVLVGVLVLVCWFDIVFVLYLGR